MQFFNFASAVPSLVSLSFVILGCSMCLVFAGRATSQGDFVKIFNKNQEPEPSTYVCYAFYFCLLQAVHGLAHTVELWTWLDICKAFAGKCLLFFHIILWGDIYIWSKPAYILYEGSSGVLIKLFGKLVFKDVTEKL